MSNKNYRNWAVGYIWVFVHDLNVLTAQSALILPDTIIRTHYDSDLGIVVIPFSTKVK